MTIAVSSDMTNTRSPKAGNLRRIAVAIASLGLLLAAPGARAAEPYFLLKITEPDDGATIRDNGGKAIIGVIVAPPLDTAAGHRLELLLDGEAVEQSQLMSFDLADLPRGTHTVRVEVRDGDGNVLLPSDPVTFYMSRASRHYGGGRGSAGAQPGYPSAAPAAPSGGQPSGGQSAQPGSLGTPGSAPAGSGTPASPGGTSGY